jgi:cyclic 2,3-diphosphoglycerate synthetase
LQEIEREYNLVGLVFLGGTEKVDQSKKIEDYGLPVEINGSMADRLESALKKFKPEAVIDLSDEPVLDYKARFELANITLFYGARYLGADFALNPVVFHDVVSKPSISVIGTGKRIGKTAVSAYFCRLLKKSYNPVVLAMGRGGPPEPEILHGEKIKIEPEYLLSESLKGKHAASDYYEDALMSRITTIGCRRCGGGLAGEPFISNVLEGAIIAQNLPNDVVVFEGSGSTLPPVKSGKTILCIGANQPLEYIEGYFGRYRVLLSDLVIVTMCEEPLANPQKIDKIFNSIKSIKDVPVICTVFRPKPLDSITNKKIILITTAKAGLETIKNHLENEYNCEVVKLSNNLSNRVELVKEISPYLEESDVVVTELKAAAVDVVTKIALENKKQVVYIDNEPQVVGGDGSLDKLLSGLVKGDIGQKAVKA